jgi:hypothetical protein
VTSTPSEQVDLLLDEMFSPKIANALRDRGWHVVAIAERVDLRVMTDEEVYAWTARPGCWLLSENVKDYQPIAFRALQAGDGHRRPAVHQQSPFSSITPESRAADRRPRRVACQETSGVATDGGLAPFRRR